MIKTDFMKLYEELGKLNERWYNVDAGWGPARLWFSDSAITFKNFMSNLSTTGIKGVRLVVAPNFYLASNAEDFNHDQMLEMAERELDLEPPIDLEQLTCGIPKCYDFELGNYEIEYLKQWATEKPDDKDTEKYLNYDPEADYKGMLVADCGTFELALYAFNSRTVPEYKSKNRNAWDFEDSETYKVLKPLIKRIYIYGK